MLTTYQNDLFEDLLSKNYDLTKEMDRLFGEIIDAVVELEDMNRAHIGAVEPILENIRREYYRVLDELKAIKGAK